MKLSDRGPKICLVAPYPPPYGGMAIQASKLASLLRDSGFDVITVKTNAQIPTAFHFVEKVKGVRTIFRTLVFLYELNKSLHKSDVVYLMSGFFDFFFWVTYPALIVIKLRRKSVILNGHGGAAEEFFTRYGLFLRPILSRVDAISVPSGFLRDVFRKTLSMTASVVPNIVDLEQFKFRERRDIQPRLLVTRSLESIYNVSCVVKAFKIVHDRFPNASLGIAGEGSQHSELERLVWELGLEKYVTFYGAVSHNDIQGIYDRYDIFMNASNVDNFPLTILEAFACGLPVVSTNVGGIPYMVEDRVTGLLVNREDCEGLARLAIDLVEKPVKAIILAKEANKECQKYSWGYVRKKLIPLLYLLKDR